MNKKTITIGCFAAIAAAVGYNANNNANEAAVTELISTNTEALADCPNGCVANGGGCYCNGSYGGYAEYNWG